MRLFLLIFHYMCNHSPLYQLSALQNRPYRSYGIGPVKYLREDAYVITLEIQGREYDSESFAGELERLATMDTTPNTMKRTNIAPITPHTRYLVVLPLW